MKFRTTKKHIISNYGVTISAGYCELQNLLRYKTPIAYTEGLYGRNADIYDIGGIAIITGRRPFGRIEANSSTCKPFDDKACEITKSDISFKEKEERLNGLISKFISEVTR